MTGQNEDIFEEFKNKFGKYELYDNALALSIENKSNPQIPIRELAQEVAIKSIPDVNSEDSVKKEKAIQKINELIYDPYHITRLLYKGMEDSKKEVVNYAKDNLEEILNKNKKDNLEKCVNILEPKKIGQEKHDYIAGLHKDIGEMSENLLSYRDKRTKEDKRRDIEKDMIKKSEEYYNKNYEGNLAKLLVLLAKYSGLVRIRKYQEILREKKSDFEKESKKDPINYILKSSSNNYDNIPLYDALIKGKDSVYIKQQEQMHSLLNNNQEVEDYNQIYEEGY